jgi:tape measure domain-containing protein
VAIAGSLVVTVSARTTEFEQGMRKTTATLKLTEQQAAQVTQAFNGLGASLTQVSTKAQGTSRAVSGVHGSVAGLSTSLLGLAAGVMSVQALSSAMSDVVKVGIDMQNLRNSFTAISGGAAAGGREFAFVVKTANSLGLELKTVAEQYRSLSAATRGTALEGQATRELFVSLSQAANTFGLSTDQLGRAMTAFQQIISKGKVSQEELRGQLTEAIPGAAQIAARAFGTTTKSLEDLIAKGVDATEFVQRFTAQLKIEVPAASDRAGKGIAQFGNEILLLKDRIAQSGVLQFFDMVQAKLADTLKQSRQAAEQRQADVERMLGPLSKFTTEIEKGMLAETLSRKNGEAEARAYIEIIQRRAAEQERFAARQKEIKEQQIDNDAILRDQTSNTKKLTESFAEQKKEKDALFKSSALAPEIYGKENGSLQDQIRLLERRKAILEKGIESTTQTMLARPERAGAVPADLQARLATQRQEYAAVTAAIEANKKAIQDEAAAIRKAAQDREEAARKAKQLAEEQRRLDLQQAEEVARVHAQNIESLRRLSDRYTSVRADRDADTASMLKASLATSQYAKEAERLAAAIEDVQRIEGQLPALRSQAKSSAAEFEAIQEILLDFEPDIQLTRREQLTKRLEDLKKVTTDQETLSRARLKMEDTLQAERMADMYEHLNDMAQELTNTFVDMAVSGEINFKRLGESFSRMVLDMVADAIDLKGALSGWLKQGMTMGMQALSGLGGTGTAMPTSGTLPTSWGQYNTMAAAGAFGGGLAAGGPVMPDKYYLVGENGPELFAPGQSGTVIPNGAGARPVVINMTVNANDADSFRRSGPQISKAMMQAGHQARRVM